MRFVTATKAMASLGLAAATRYPRVSHIAAAVLARTCEWSPKIAAARAALYECDDPSGVEDRTVGEHAATSVTPAWGRTLYHLVRNLQPETVVEMGTSGGISSAYLGAAMHDSGAAGRVFTLEKSVEMSRAARDLHARLGLDGVIEVRTGVFHELLSELLSEHAPVDLVFVDGHHQEEPTVAYFEQLHEFLSDTAVVVFDDVGCSDGMRSAWRRIRDSERTRFAVALDRMGVWGGTIEGVS